MNHCFCAERSAEAVPRQTRVSEFSETGLESYLTISRYHISTDSARKKDIMRSTCLFCHAQRYTPRS